MKYKVSVIKKIAFLVMTMALAVAMVACRVLSASPASPGPATRDQGPAGSEAIPDMTPTRAGDANYASRWPRSLRSDPGYRRA